MRALFQSAERFRAPRWARTVRALGEVIVLFGPASMPGMADRSSELPDTPQGASQAIFGLPIGKASCDNGLPDSAQEETPGEPTAGR